ncbi:MAG: cupin domain-containing protein [Dehalococcoidia bacterium]|nr:cupin domain-containing protein [Dehalococcoidia bacterium]
MPFISRDNAPISQPFPGVTIRSLVGSAVGAQGLTVNENTVEPQQGIPAHVHPTHEETVVILEGEFRARVGDEERVVRPGDIVLVPQGVRHQLLSVGARPGRILAIFPTLDVVRQLVE